MAEDLLSSFLCAAVQAFLSARWSEGRERSSLTARGSAYAKRCVCTVVAGRVVHVRCVKFVSVKANSNKSTVVREKEALMTVFFCFRGNVFLPFVMADGACLTSIKRKITYKKRKI